MKKFYFSALVMFAFSTVSLACVRSQSTLETTSPQSESQPLAETAQPSSAAPTADAFPRQPILLPDRVEPRSEFDQFRSRLRQAVRDRDIEFVKALIPADGVGMGFGVPITKQALDNIDTGAGASLWRALEHAIAIGCDASEQYNYLNVDRNTRTYECPNTSIEFQRQYPAPANSQGVSYEMSRVIVVGENVNVHERQDSNSSVVGTLSNEVVRFDQATWERMSDEERVAQLESRDGWIPVILPNGKAGSISNRYAYFPIGYRAIFGKVNGEWQLLYVPGGD
ncbi:MAG: hypothetical protein F6K28_38005 [Microcoleus sp. SIO2G3]|nr:hypothetical protein [Microcoleus sp. SIO2G3]